MWPSELSSGLVTSSPPPRPTPGFVHHSLFFILTLTLVS